MQILMNLSENSERVDDWAFNALSAIKKPYRHRSKIDETSSHPNLHIK
jgi:hypothetical protein